MGRSVTGRCASSGARSSSGYVGSAGQAALSSSSRPRSSRAGVSDASIRSAGQSERWAPEKRRRSVYSFATASGSSSSSS
jgi:hypothetical protein